MFRHVWIAMIAAMLAVLVPVLRAKAQAPCEGWTPIGGPQARTNNAMAYDSRRGVVVMFGGSGGGGTLTTAPLSDTWEHDGRRWRFRSVDGPSPRYGCTMAYDARRGVTVLFGGLGGTLGMGEFEVGVVWEWDGATWTRRGFPNGPQGDEYVRSAYDAARGVVLVWPVRDAAGMYAYDGTGWTLIPRQDVWPIRESGTWVYDSHRQVVVVPDSCCGNIWEWDGARWTFVAAQAYYSNAVFAFDSLRQRVVAMGMDQTAEWDGTRWTSFPQSLADRLNIFGAIAFHERRGVSIAFGGIGTPTSGFVPNDDTLVREGTTWRRQPPATRPPPTYNASMSFDSRRATSMLLGGTAVHGAAISAMSDSWLLRGETWHRAPADQVGAMNVPLVAYDPTRDETIAVASGRTWRWTGVTWTVAASTTPVGVTAGMAAFDPNVGSLYALYFNAAWRWDGSGWPRDPDVGDLFSIIWPTVAFDESRGRLLGVGTRRGGPSVVYTAVRENGRWVELNAGGPNGGDWSQSRYAYAPSRGKVMAMGSSSMDDSTVPPRAWFFDGVAWTSEFVRGPVRRAQHAMAYDSVAQRVVLHAGAGRPMGAYLADTWKFAAGPADVGLQPVVTRVVWHRPTSLFLVASGGGVIDYQWRRDGVPMVESDRVQGVDSDTLTFESSEFGDSGEYDCIVTNACGSATSVRVHLSVGCPADLDDGAGMGVPDNAVTTDDLLYFLARFAEGASAADVDNGTAFGTPDGGVTIEDLLFFLTRFELGC